MSQQIIGLQRVLQTKGSGQTWNNKTIRWSIVHNANNQTRRYDVELEMVLMSSKRIVRVNGQVKDTQMCSFGYEARFEINQRLKGYIRQDSLSFELFVNEQSFTRLQEMNKKPPKMEVGEEFWRVGEKGKEKEKEKEKKGGLFSGVTQGREQEQNAPVLGQVKKTTSATQEQNTLTKSIQYQPLGTKYETPQLKHKPVSSEMKQDKKATQTVIKDTQGELMRILMEEKKRKKAEQQQQQAT